jgi:hypothetical protein
LKAAGEGSYICRRCDSALSLHEPTTAPPSITHWRITALAAGPLAREHRAFIKITTTPFTTSVQHRATSIIETVPQHLNHFLLMKEGYRQRKTALYEPYAEASKIGVGGGTWVGEVSE